jgi:polysaccharide export outer membrane protein
MKTTGSTFDKDIEAEKLAGGNYAMKIFVVDDDEFSLNMYGQYLQNIGYSNVTLISEGEKCLAKLQEEPDVIFLDHHMQDLSGMETLQKIKKYNPHIRVVIVSAQENIRVAVSFIKQGAYDYIVKGDDEMLRMKVILKKLDPEELHMKHKRWFSHLDRSSTLTATIAIVLLITQCAFVFYYFSSSLLISGLGCFSIGVVALLWIFRKRYKSPAED